MEKVEKIMSEEGSRTAGQSDILRMAVEIVSAYVSNNLVPAGQVPEVINTVYNSLNSLGGPGANGTGEPPKPAVSVRRSVTAARSSLSADFSSNPAWSAAIATDLTAIACAFVGPT